MGSNKETIDENLYSRQLYVLGHDAMRKMQASDILICGMGGLGVEVAKNIVLGGVKSVTIHDPVNVSYQDLSSQYFLKESDIGKNRAECTHLNLSELNPHVPIYHHTSDLNEEFLKKFQVVILTDNTLSEQISIGKFCHKSNIKFIAADTKGVFGKIFCDFGPEFTVYDTNGQPQKSSMISYITKDTNGIVTTHDLKRHDLEDGDFVKFSEVKGMTEVNGKEFEIKVIGPYSFSIGDTSGFNEYANSGIITEVKKPKKLNFKPIDAALIAPNYLISDDIKEKDNNTIHICFQACDKYQAKNNRLPRAWNKLDASEFVEIAKDINATLETPFDNLNKDLLVLFSSVCCGSLCPVQGVIGGLVAQEAMKACSGKFHPVLQFFYYDCRECLPEDYMTLLHENEQLDQATHRYHSQEVIFGKEFQEKLSSIKCFLVGSGALGCEYLKHFAMIGLCCGVDGHLTVTDMDTIEKSNLNRQFLFRSWDVLKFKAEVSTRAAKSMNPQMNVTPNLNRVAPETDSIYSHDFFQSLDFVCNALDNVDARLYIDSKCVDHKKPLIESGTRGTEANTQVVLPFLTEAYSSSQDPPEKTYPMCTLKNFPNTIEHTLLWARESFESLFHSPVKTAQNFQKNPTSFLQNMSKQTSSQQLDELEQLEKVFITEKCSNYLECLTWAHKTWQTNFHDKIVNLLFNFPADQLSSSGLPFWSGPKRCPHYLEFNVNNSLHFEYVYSSANLKAEMYGIHREMNTEEIAKILKEIKSEEFKPRANIQIDENGESQSDDIDQEDEEKIEQLLKIFTESNEQFKDIELYPIEFEKDDDSNFHMDYITACSNLRAENYDIAPSDKHNSKLIAGKIIPAIATTTSVIVGLDCIELYKIVQGHKKLEYYKNTYINLALPFFSSSEPMPVAKNKYNDTEWSLWDHFHIKGDMKLKEFIAHFERKHDLKISMINKELVTVYSDFLPKSRSKERMELRLKEILESTTKDKVPDEVINLCISCYDKDGNDVEVPMVKIFL